jgi:hypothetical protein
MLAQSVRLLVMDRPVGVEDRLLIPVTLSVPSLPAEAHHAVGARRRIRSPLPRRLLHPPVVAAGAGLPHVSARIQGHSHARRDASESEYLPLRRSARRARLACRCRHGQRRAALRALDPGWAARHAMESTRAPNDMSEYRDGVMARRRGSWESASPRPATPGLDARPGRPDRWRRLARCYEGTAASVRAWLEVASFGYLLGRV